MKTEKSEFDSKLNKFSYLGKSNTSTASKGLLSTPQVTAEIYLYKL